MSKLEWGEENLPSLGKLFLMRVNENMRSDESRVRFGLAGTGSSPNYKVELPNGKSLAYGGLSHEQYSRVDTFEEKMLSRPFTRQQIIDAIAKAPSSGGR